MYYLMRLLVLLTILSLANTVLAEEINVTFLLTNDIYNVEQDGKERGGFARLAAVVKAEREKSDNVIFAHAGDTFSPSLLSGFDQGEHIMALTNMLAPDVFAPGNHEFDFGPDIFKQRIAQATFPVLAANLRDEQGQPIANIEDTQMLQFGSAKIGIIGLAADNSPVKSSPGNLQFTPIVETGIAQASALREAGADIIVVVAHADRGQDRQLFNSGAFDIILTGDDHDLMLFFDGKKLMVESGEEAETVTAIDVAITVKEGDRRRVSWYPTFRLIDTADVTPDPTVKAEVDRYVAMLSDELDVAIGTTETELDSQRASVRGGETAIGNLIVDAMRQAVSADIAITNGGGIRGNTIYPAGSELTRRTILTELPFGNKNLLLEVTGQQVLDALENGFSQVENGAGRFPHVSGMKVTIDLNKPAGERVVSAMIGDQALNPSGNYKLATNDYMANGGDGYKALKSAKVLLGSLDGKLMANDVMAYIRASGTIKPMIEGRIVKQ